MKLRLCCLVSLLALAMQAPGAAAFTGEVIINEIAWAGTGSSPDDEWIELYNTTSLPVDLTGWTLTAGSGSPAISLSGAVRADGYLLLERGDAAAGTTYTGDLADAGDSLVLKDAAGQVVDTANQDGGPWPGGSASPGRTMERINPFAPDADGNWGTGDGTPGGRNSAFAAPPLVARMVAEPDTSFPGGTIRYRVIITNTTGADAAGVRYAGAVDPSTTLDPATVAATPVAFDQVARTEPDTPLEIILTGSDPDGDVLTFAIVAGPAGGSLGPVTRISPASASVTYTPGAGFAGLDAFTFAVDDGTGPTGAATVSLQVGIPPAAVDDGYTATGNIAIAVDAADGLLANDSGSQIVVTRVQGDAAYVGAAAPTAATGLGGETGSVVVQADGSFTYEPPPGFVGDDSFTYTIDNVFAAPSTATVTIAVSQMAWFVDASAPAGGSGTFARPFRSIAEFNAVQAGAPPGAKPGDLVYLFAGTYGDGIELQDGQTLLGSGADIAAALAADARSAPPYPPAIGPRPVIAPGAGNGILLAQNNAVRGLDVGDTPGGFGLADNGGSVGSLTIGQVAVTGAGGALRIAAGGSLDATFDQLASGGSPGEGIRVQGISGSLTVTGTTTITAPAAHGIFLQNSPGAAFDLGVLGDVATSAGRALVADNSGTLTIAGSPAVSAVGGAALDIRSSAVSGFTFASLTSTGSPAEGVLLSQVTGAVAVTGPTAVDEAAGAGIAIVNSSGSVAFAGVSVTNRNSTGLSIYGAGGAVSFGSVAIPNPKGAPGYGVRVLNSSADVTIASVDIRDAVRSFDETAGPDRQIPTSDSDGDGIFLKDNAGRFTLNGGTIAGSGDNALDMRNVADVVLENVVIDGTADSGIQGVGVRNFTFSNSRIANFGDDLSGASPPVHDSGLWFRDLSGTVVIDNSTIGPDAGFVPTLFPPGIPNDGIEIWNRSADSLAVTVTGLTVTGISDDGIDIRAQRSRAALQVGGSSRFDQINGRAISLEHGADDVGNDLLDLVVSDSRFDQVGVAARLSAAGAGQGKMQVRRDTASDVASDAVRLLGDPAGAGFTTVVDARVDSSAFGGGGALIAARRGADLQLLFQDNAGLGGQGIAAEASRQGDLDAIFLDNEVLVNTDAPDFALAAFFVQAANPTPGPADACVDVRDNTFGETGGAADPVAFDQTGTSTIHLAGFGGGGNPAAASFVDAQNTLTGGISSPPVSFFAGTVSAASSCSGPVF